MFIVSEMTMFQCFRQLIHTTMHESSVAVVFLVMSVPRVVISGAQRRTVTVLVVSDGRCFSCRMVKTVMGVAVVGNGMMICWWVTFSSWLCGFVLTPQDVSEVCHALCEVTVKPILSVDF